MSEDELIKAIDGKSLETEKGDLKYRPLLLPVRIGSDWYTVLLASGAGSSLIA